MDQVLIPVGHRALFLPSMNGSWGDYHLGSLFGISSASTTTLPMSIKRFFWGQGAVGL
jgi:hypothetical protein